LKLRSRINFNFYIETSEDEVGPGVLFFLMGSTSEHTLEDTSEAGANSSKTLISQGGFIRHSAWSSLKDTFLGEELFGTNMMSQHVLQNEWSLSSAVSIFLHPPIH